MRKLWSRFLGKPPASDPGSERWRTTLRAAAAVPYYARWKKQLLRAAHAAGEEARRDALARLPEVELEAFFRDFRLFRDRDATSVKPRDAREMWPGDSRLAVVAPWFHVSGAARLLIKPDLEELRKTAPDVVAAPVDVLESLAAQGPWPEETSLFAVLVLAGVGTPMLTAAARERLWRAFGVPVYLQLRGFHGEQLARECEAHNGLHFHSSEVIVERRPSGELLLTSLAHQRHTVLRLGSRLEANLEMSPCECGLATPRLMDVQPLRQRSAGSDPKPASLSALAAAVGESQPVGVESSTLATSR